MSAFDCIFGNEKTVAALKKSIASGKAAASYIISGPEMSGKFTLTKEFACALTEKTSADNAELMCRKIREGISPDITVCSPADKKSIGIEDIRDIFRTVYTTPNELDFRMFIIRGAHTLTVQAQNALLKVFEEPPQDSYIFLLCESRAKLLPTLISRAQNVDTEIFDMKTLEGYFKGKHDVGRDRAELAYLLSGGALGKAEKLLSDDEITDVYRSVCDIIASFENGDSYASLDTVLKACSSREACGEALEMLSLAAGDVINASLGADKRTRFFMTEKEAKNAAGKADAEKIASLLDRLSELQANLDYNANAASTAFAAFIALKECFRR